MRLKVPKVDARTVLGSSMRHEIIDEDSGRAVGYFNAGQGSESWSVRSRRNPSRYVNLFDGKYCGEFESHEECAAFVKGVEVVLTHMVLKNDKSIHE